MSHNHFLIVCRECEKVMFECNCPWISKPKYREVCEECKRKLMGFDIEKDR